MLALDIKYVSSTRAKSAILKPIQRDARSLSTYCPTSGLLTAWEPLKILFPQRVPNLCSSVCRADGADP
jgi:hypothetical protein